MNDSTALVANATVQHAIDAAIADYRAALKLDPDMQSAKAALTRLGAVP